MTRKSRTLKLLDKEVRNWLLRNVKLGEEGELSYAVLKDDGYTINLGSHIDDLTDEQARTIVFHEIAHILRGDCLVKDKTLDHYLMNVAMDSIINSGFPNFREMFADPPWYPDLAEQFEELPKDWVPGWKVIYDVLAKNGVQMVAIDGAPKNETTDKEKAERAHAKVILEARKVKELTELGAGAGIVDGSRRAVVQPQPLPKWARLLAKVNRKVRRNGFGSLVRVRTYNRPGRVEGLRGIARQPRLTIMVILDVSGSCANLEPVFRGLAATLKRHYNVRLGIFANEFAEVKHPAAEVDVGGGTVWKPVKEGIDKAGPSLAIVLTDGEFFDDLVLPKCPVWFVVYGSEPHWTNRLRPKDKVIMDEG